MAKKVGSYAQSMVERIQTALESTPAAVVEVRFADGRVMTYDRAQALKELTYWEKKVDVENGKAASRNKVHFGRMIPPGAI